MSLQMNIALSGFDVDKLCDIAERLAPTTGKMRETVTQLEPWIMGTIPHPIKTMVMVSCQRWFAKCHLF